MVTPAGLPHIRNCIVEALAQVLAADVNDIEREIDANGGDLDLDSPQAMAVISKLEKQFGGCRLLAKPDFKRGNFDSVDAMTSFIGRKLTDVS